MRVSTKRILSGILSLFFLFLAFIIFIYFIKPVYEETQNLRAEALQKENQLNKQKVLIREFQNLVEKYGNQKDVQQVFSLILPTNLAIGDALTQINGLLSYNNMLGMSFNVSRPVIQNLYSATPSANFLKPVGTFDITFKFSGSYEDFKNFLNQLETNIRIFDIKNLSISPLSINLQSLPKTSTSTAQRLSYDITVTTYYQSE
jgi:Tfp pilus assembly protein PilO